MGVGAAWKMVVDAGRAFRAWAGSGWRDFKYEVVDVRLWIAGQWRDFREATRAFRQQTFAMLKTAGRALRAQVGEFRRSVAGSVRSMARGMRDQFRSARASLGASFRQLRASIREAILPGQPRQQGR